MLRFVTSRIPYGSWIVAWATLAMGLSAATPDINQAKQQSSVQQYPPLVAPSSADIDARAQRLAANQHRDDEALKQYERIERHTDLAAAPSPHVIEDKTFRVVPTMLLPGP